MLVAAERTEAPGRAPEGVKPRCCGQMDAKGNKVIKEEEAERRRQGDRGGGVEVRSGWLNQVGVGEQRSPRGPCGLCFLFFDFDSRVMFIYFFLFRIEVEVILDC